MQGSQLPARLFALVFVAIPIESADAIVAEINAAKSTFVLSDFTAVRSLTDWDHDFKDLDTMAVDVVFGTNQPDGSIALDDATHLKYEYFVDIAVRKRFEPNEKELNGRIKNSASDPLIALLQQIGEHFAARRNGEVLPGYPHTNWVGGGVMSWGDHRKLRKGLFEAVVRVHLETVKEI